MPKAVLEGLKRLPVRISVICAMLDSGGSAGRERKIYKTNVSFGDIRRAFLALSESSQEVKDAFNIRFKEGPYAGLVVANVLGTAMITQKKSYENVFDVYREVLKIPECHEILPATLDNADICATLENGKTISGEKNIDKPQHDKKLRIKKVFLCPEPQAYPKAEKAILDSDLIVVGPGDLYSTLAQILLISGINNAIKASKAKIVYICNLMTKNGETNDFGVADFTAAIESFLGKELDYVIYNTRKPEIQRIEIHKKECPELLELVSFNGLSASEKFLGSDILTPVGSVVHDSRKLAKIILKLSQPEKLRFLPRRDEKYKLNV